MIERYNTGMGCHFAVFETKEEAETYLNKFKEHSEYLCFIRQHCEGEWYVEIRYKGR